MDPIKNINGFKKRKENKQPISVITCYDFAFARILESTEIDAILIGDTVGMIQAGFTNTLPVTVDQMIYHTKNVRTGTPSKFLITDLPFLSYHISVEDSLRNAGKILKETGANAIKLEGGNDFRKIIEALVKASIPVMGHLGLTPQSIHKLGGYSVQGRAADKRKLMIEDAKILEEAGVFSIVLEMVPESLAQEISELVSVPTIGIGAGRYCDGQVLVLNDLLGFDENFNPKFLKKYANIAEITRTAVNQYSNDVHNNKFPTDKNIFQ